MVSCDYVDKCLISFFQSYQGAGRLNSILILDQLGLPGQIISCLLTATEFDFFGNLLVGFFYRKSVGQQIILNYLSFPVFTQFLYLFLDLMLVLSF